MQKKIDFTLVALIITYLLVIGLVLVPGVAKGLAWLVFMGLLFILNTLIILRSKNKIVTLVSILSIFLNAIVLLFALLLAYSII